VTALADGVFERQPPPPPPAPPLPYTQNQDNYVNNFVVNVPNPRDDLFVVSQPAGTALTDISSYAYDTENAQQVVVYVMDTGADLTSRVSSQNVCCCFVINYNSPLHNSKQQVGYSAGSFPAIPMAPT
jgi:hypothetical protein